MNSAFLNGPTEGRDVFIPMDYIIGGTSRVGHGWRMLMECLAAGRSISLPASSIGGMKLAARTSGAYARVRKQFKMPIGRFEGVEEPMARIGAHTYMVDAARQFTALAVDLGEKPSVVSAIIKIPRHRARPHRHQRRDGRAWRQGHLSRAGQLSGALLPADADRHHRRRREHPDPHADDLRPGGDPLHPYVLKEIAATQDHNHQRALKQFDEALFGHISFAVSNAVRSFVHGLTGGRGIHTRRASIRGVTSRS